jgi:hypothetical protein
VCPHISSRPTPPQPDYQALRDSEPPHVPINCGTRDSRHCANERPSRNARRTTRAIASPSRGRGQFRTAHDADRRLLRAAAV